MSTPLQSKGDTHGSAVALLGFGGLLVVVALVLFVVANPVTIVLGVVALCAAVFLVFFGYRALRVATRLEPGVLDLPPGPLRLDQHLDVLFRRTVKRGPADAQLSAILRLTEWCRYRRGTDVHTVSKVVREIPLPIQPVPDPLGVAGRLALAVPSYPPSFKASDNTLAWTCHIEATFTDGFKEDSVFELLIAPETVAGQMGRVGR